MTLAMRLALTREERRTNCLLSVCVRVAAYKLLGRKTDWVYRNADISNNDPGCFVIEGKPMNDYKNRTSETEDANAQPSPSPCRCSYHLAPESPVARGVQRRWPCPVPGSR